MIDKNTYNVEELAEALNINPRKVFEMIRNNEIEHIHLNQTHANVRIPKTELMRLLGETL
jgi:excisionase family DNA binding protein